MGNQRGLYRLYVLPLHVAGGELRPKLIKISEPLLSADQIGVGNGIGGPSKEIGQAHLIAHTRRQHVEGQIEGPGNLLEDAVKKFVSCGLNRRGATFLSDF